MNINERIVEETFILICEALLSNYSCGKLLITSNGQPIRKDAFISEECDYFTLEDKYVNLTVGSKGEVYGNTVKRTAYLEACKDKYDTLLCTDALLAFRAGHKLSSAYIMAALKAIKRGGRLLIPIAGHYMSSHYNDEIRNHILDLYSVERIIYLSSKEFGIDSFYILDITNSNIDRPIKYFYYSKYKSFGDMLLALQNDRDAIIADKRLLFQRWDAQFVNPEYNEIRKNYLAKDTIKISDIALVFCGVPIKDSMLQTHGEYLLLTPGLVVDGHIVYQDDNAQYIDVQNHLFFKRAILEEGDIVVCNAGKIFFFIYHKEAVQVVAGWNFHIVRASEHNKKYLELYFNTKIGKDSFSLQAEMLSGTSRYQSLFLSDLSSFYVPNIKTLEMADRIQENTSLINKVAMLFESEGWQVKKDYKPDNSINLEFDIALITSGKVVGVVEAKRNKALNREEKRRIKEYAEKAMSISDIQFYIVFINDAMYRYCDNEFYRIPEIPTPSTFHLYNTKEGFYINDPYDSDVKEVPEEVRSISDSYLILSAITDLGRILGDKIDVVQKSVDNISSQIQELLGRICIYQEFVEKQLNYAKEDTDEQERIIKVFTDTCVERVIERIQSEYARELYDDERIKIIDSMGESAWNKLDADAQNFLISSKVMYAKLVGISDVVDYSGVCLLVTKALELELGKRFCQNYVAYYKMKYPGKEGRRNAPLTILNRYGSGYIKGHEFTLGTFPFIVGCQFASGLTDTDIENIRSKTLEYVKQGVLKSYALSHSDEEILELLSDYAEEVDRVKKDYRNPSAHTNALTKVSAKECFDLVIDVEKLLKRMLDSFDE